jgi:ABC-2 type transport system permease protein
MTGPGRYLRLYSAFARFGLASEMAFRANFLIKLLVEALWLAILLAFYGVIYGRTNTVADWNLPQYLFFIGCHYALSGVIETFFLENCIGFAELVRTGDLDFYLLRPIDEQFLVSTRHLDWSTSLNILQGAGVMVYALAINKKWSFDPGTFALFLILFACGCAMAYSFLLMLSSLSVYLVRNQSLMEMWWLFTTLMRYPRKIFEETAWARPIGGFFTFIVPVLLVVSVPAETMVRALKWDFVLLTAASAVVLLLLSRWFFRRALRSYRSASS